MSFKFLTYFLSKIFKAETSSDLQDKIPTDKVALNSVTIMPWLLSKNIGSLIQPLIDGVEVQFSVEKEEYTFEVSQSEVNEKNHLQIKIKRVNNI